MFAARRPSLPGAMAAPGAGAHSIGVGFAEASASETEFRPCRHPAQFAAAKGGLDFANERWGEAVDDLPIVFFIAARLPWSGRRGIGICAAAQDSPEIRSRQEIHAFAVSTGT